MTKEIESIKERLKIIEFKLDKIMDVIESKESNLEYGYSWINSLEEDMIKNGLMKR